MTKKRLPGTPKTHTSHGSHVHRGDVRLGDQVPARVSDTIQQSLQFLVYDDDNLFPDRMIKLLCSPTHNAIIHTKQNMICSNGLQVPDGELQTRTFLLDAFECDGGIDEFIKLTALDLLLFGGFAWQIGWSVNGQNIVWVKHQPFNQVRYAKPDLQTGECEGFYLAGDWRFPWNYQFPAERLRYIPEFDLDDRILDQPCLFYYREKTPFNSYYPVPDYDGAIPAIQSEIDYFIMVNNSIRYSFTPAAMVVFPENISEEKHKKRVEQLELNFTGVNNAGRIIGVNGAMNHLEQGFIMPQITVLEATNHADLFSLTGEVCRQAIVTAHQIDPALANLPTPNNLNSDGKKRLVVEQQFYNSYIRSKQDTILKPLKRILAINGLSTNVDLIFTPTITSFETSYDKDFMSLNEKRKENGLPPVDDPTANIPQSILDYQLLLQQQNGNNPTQPSSNPTAGGMA